jgi:hypothetical protein
MYKMHMRHELIWYTGDGVYVREGQGACRFSVDDSRAAIQAP